MTPGQSTTDKLSFYKVHSSVEYEALQKENAERRTILIQENFRHGFSCIRPSDSFMKFLSSPKGAVHPYPGKRILHT